MKPLHVEWVHGWDAKPWGTKSTALRDEALARSVNMDGLDYQQVRDPEERADMLAARVTSLSEDYSVALAGSSMGGYVSLVACREVPVLALWLLCPAIGFEVTRHRRFPWLDRPTTVIHGWQDASVPVDRSIAFAREHGAVLHIMNGDHRFQGRLPEITGLFRLFLDQLETLARG